MEPEAEAPALLHLLDISVPPAQVATSSPQERKLQLFAVLRQLLLSRSAQQPLVLVVENLHWIDATSEAWLTSLVECLTAVPILLLVTYRPGYRPPWIEHSAATQIALPRLSPQESRTVVQSLLQETSLSEVQLQDLIAKAAGNPFFLEELAWTVVEQGTHASVTIPDTIQAVLAARIDRLPPAEKRLLQTAALIGKQITLPLLGAVMAWPEEVLRTHLQFLQAAEFLYEAQAAPSPVYAFKHALTQEVASQSLLQHTRQQSHQYIAHVLTSQFPNTAATQPELLAYHYTEAGDKARAVPCWQRAGQRAMQRSAFEEAIAHFSTGLELLKALPETPDRAQHELSFHLSLVGPIRIVKGNAAPEVAQLYARVRTLCQQVGDPSQLFLALQGLHLFYWQRAELQTAREVVEQSLAQAQRLHDPALRMLAHQDLGHVLCHLGEFVAARRHAEQGMALYHSLPRRYEMTTDPGVFCLAHTAWVLWFLGYPDRALAYSQEAITLAQTHPHPHSLVTAMGRDDHAA